MNPTDSGACTNESDLAAIEASYDGRTFYEVATDCGITTYLSTLGSAFHDCVSGCVDDATGASGPSDACTDCYVTFLECTANNCLTACLGVDCTACLCGDNKGSINCIGEFEACSGINSTTCDGV